MSVSLEEGRAVIRQGTVTPKTEGREDGPHVRDRNSYTMKGLYVVCGRCIVDYQCFSVTWMYNCLSP